MADTLTLEAADYFRFRTAALEVACAEQMAARMAADAKLVVARAEGYKDRVVAELAAKYPEFDASAVYCGDDTTCTLRKDS